MKKIREIANKIFRSESVSGYLNFVSLVFSISIFVRVSSALIFLTGRAVFDNFILAQIVGCYDDFIFLGYLLLLLAPVYFVFFLGIGKRSADSFALAVLVFYLITELIFSWYFALSMSPFSYHLIQAVESEQASQVAAIYGFQKYYLVFLIPGSLIIFIGLWKINKRMDSSFLKTTAVFVFAMALIVSCFIKISPTHFESELNYQSARNKVGYFLESYLIFQSEKSQFQNMNQDAEIKKFYALNDISKKDYYDYPFFSETDVRNPLGSYFPERDSAPNVVFIICESLGKQFSGDGARLGSFTPFLDSLANHSLYWSNFMSNAERTFGALPNILGGLPEGETGFMNLRYDSPDHLSLPQLLKENNGYQTAFFCGANKEFDHMDEFLMTEKFDLIKSKSDFKLNENKTEIEDKKGNKKQFNWGAEDKEVFTQSLGIIDSSFRPDKPYCNVYLTTSFHEPFNYSNEEFFIQLAKKRIDELEPTSNADYLNQTETFAALLYMDFALKYFITEYQTRPEFENTIFVICGDHSIKFLDGDTRLEKFHVPLLIYSPMLLKTKRIKSIACHKDIPAALQGLLKENFALKLPDNAISQSDNLDTSEKFQTGNCNHVLMYADRRMNGYVWKDYLYMEDVLYRIKDDLKIEQVDEPHVLRNLKDRISNYRLISQYVCVQNKWVPDSLFEKFTENRNVLRTKIDFETITKDRILFPVQLITTNEAFTGIKSLTNLGDEYLNLFKNVSVDGTKRVRLKVKFAIKTNGEAFPSLVVYQNEIVGNSEAEIVSKTFLLNNSNSNFVKSDKAEWYFYEMGFWFDTTVKVASKQKIGAFLFDNSGSHFFVDDLEIELQEF